MTKKELQPLLSILRIPSVSTQDEYRPEMEKVRGYLMKLFTSMGFAAKILKGQKHDLVFAEKKEDASLPTLLIYGHYDVQPPAPLEEWVSPPFEPTIRDGKIYARGATDNKGQLMIHIMAIQRVLKENGKLPLNVKFIIEGEEEIGSVSVEDIAQQYAQSLLRCDYLVVSDSEMPRKGQPSIDVSLRGLVYAEVTVESARHDLHSGQFGGVAENPAIVLARIITKLKDERNRVLIPGFYDDVYRPSKTIVDEFKALGTTPSQIKKEGSLFSIGGGEEGYSINQRRWTRPTLDVNGIVSGYTGPGTKTIIPAKASAKVSMRLVPHQDPKRIYVAFQRYVRKQAPKTVKLKLEEHAHCYPYLAPTDHPVFRLVRESLKTVFKREPVYIGVGGSIGFVPVMAKALDVPCLLVGFGLPDENLHAPNEHFSLQNYSKGILAMSDFLKKLPKWHQQYSRRGG